MASERNLVKELEDVRSRLQVLEDKEAIRDVLARYSFDVDLNRLDSFGELFTPDATFDLTAEEVYNGRDQIKGLMKGPRHQAVAERSQHVQVNYVIDVKGDTATATGYGIGTMHWSGGFGIWRCSMRSWSLKRVRGRWLIKKAVTRATGDPECHQVVATNV